MEKKKEKKTWLLGICIVLALVLGLVILGVVYANFLLDMIGRAGEGDQGIYTPEQAATMTDPDPLPPNFSGPTYDPEDIPLLPTPTSPSGTTRSVVNILLIGQDRRQGEGRQRSDTLILCSFNRETGTLTLTSFMRDLYVSIPGYSPNKLNAAYKWGGFELVKQTLQENFRVPVDACVEVDFGGFMEIIDLVGGVEISLTEAESEYMKTVGNFPVKPGKNKLTGAQALFYARLRKIDDDFHRTQRQRNVLTALLQRCKDLSLPQMHRLLMTALPLLTTDMTKGEMVTYLTELFPILTGGNVQSLRIPAQGMYEDVRVGNMQVLLADMEATRRLLNEKLLGK